MLWRELTRANTIIPTTVSCEQSFSVVKHATHVNMKPATFMTNATNKYLKNQELNGYENKMKRYHSKRTPASEPWHY